jgi:hypothetical protein
MTDVIQYRRQVEEEKKYLNDLQQRSSNSNEGRKDWSVWRHSSIGGNEDVDDDERKAILQEKQEKQCNWSRHEERKWEALALKNV